MKKLLFVFGVASSLLWLSSCRQESEISVEDYNNYKIIQKIQSDRESRATNKTIKDSLVLRMSDDILKPPR